MKPPPVSHKSPWLHRYAGAFLTLLAIAIGGFAAVRWASLLGSEPQAIATTSDTRAWALLGRALRANSDVPFEARAETVVFVGARSLQSESRIVRTPGHMAVTYLSGPMKGQGGGYSNRLFWRQDAAGALVPYAQMQSPPDQIAERRFELMRSNYQARMCPPDEIDGRPVEVVELRPARPQSQYAGPARRVFLDDATGLTLRTEEFNARLQPASHSTFSQLSLRPTISQTTFLAPSQLSNAGSQSFWRGEELGDDARGVEQKTGLKPPESAKVPRGWKRDGFGVHRCDQSGDASQSAAMQVAAFTRYTDGLNVLMLFAIKSARVEDMTVVKTNASSSATCSFGPGTLASRKDGAGTLLAIGDLPPETLRRVLQGARFQEVTIAVATPTPTVATVPIMGVPGRK